MDTLRLFGGEQWLSAFVGIETQYFYALLGLLAPWAFILFPSKLWVDWPLAIAFVAILAGLFITAEQALDEAWEFAAPDYAVYASIALWAMLLEALRRAAGWPLCLIAGAFSILPVVTEYMPASLVDCPPPGQRPHLTTCSPSRVCSVCRFVPLLIWSIGFVVWRGFAAYRWRSIFFKSGVRDFG